MPLTLTRITFSTPVTPTRERLTWVAGVEAWTSGGLTERVGVCGVIASEG